MRPESLSSCSGRPCCGNVRVAVRAQLGDPHSRKRLRDGADDLLSAAYSVILDIVRTLSAVLAQFEGMAHGERTVAIAQTHAMASE